MYDGDKHHLPPNAALVKSSDSERLEESTSSGLCDSEEDNEPLLSANASRPSQFHSIGLPHEPDVGEGDATIEALEDEEDDLPLAYRHPSAAANFHQNYAEFGEEIDGQYYADDLYYNSPESTGYEEQFYGSEYQYSPMQQQQQVYYPAYYPNPYPVMPMMYPPFMPQPMMMAPQPQYYDQMSDCCYSYQDASANELDRPKLVAMIDELKDRSHRDLRQCQSTDMYAHQHYWPEDYSHGGYVPMAPYTTPMAAACHPSYASSYVQSPSSSLAPSSASGSASLASSSSHWTGHSGSTSDQRDAPLVHVEEPLHSVTKLTPDMPNPFEHFVPKRSNAARGRTVPTLPNRPLIYSIDSRTAAERHPRPHFPGR